MKTEYWQLGSIDNVLAVDKKACEKIFVKLTALTKFIHNIEGIVIELHIISYVTEKQNPPPPKTLRWGKEHRGRLSLLILDTHKQGGVYMWQSYQMSHYNWWQFRALFSCSHIDNGLMSPGDSRHALGTDRYITGNPCPSGAYSQRPGRTGQALGISKCTENLWLTSQIWSWEREVTPN